MNAADYERQLALPRKKTLEILDTIAGTDDPIKILGWRPGTDRAHIAWQLMHVAATDDKHLNIRMHQREASNPEFVRRFAGGSTPDDDIPSVDVIREYLTTQREALLAHLRTLSEEDFAKKPHDEEKWIYQQWFEILAWHEGHHQGQAHLTYNLYQAAQG